MEMVQDWGKMERLGGLHGWKKEEEKRQKVISEDSSQETEVGGWKGWSELPSMNSKISRESEIMLEGDVGDEEIGEDLEFEELKQEEDDIEFMMKKLGINVDAKLRALDICFAFSLDCLSSSFSTTQNAAISEENEPPISNSLMAAIK
ncbi:hypothetical protein AAC387_Pa08g2663 [Persea americana]